MNTLAYSSEVRDAVRRVGLTPEEVVDVLGSCLDGDDVYLVGSLAPDLGNAHSDIDLHVFVSDEAPGVVPMLFFAGRTRLDLVCHAVSSPAEALAKLPTVHVHLLSGVCAVGDLPGMTDLKRLSRWATAVPLFDGSPPIFADDEVERIAAALVRAALNTTVRAAALAHLMRTVGSPYAGLAWSRAAEAAVEVVVRTHGDIFVGDKWLPAKARRCLMSPQVLASARRVDSLTVYNQFVGALELPIVDAPDLVTVEQTAGPGFTFGARCYRLVGGQLVPPIQIESPMFARELERDASALSDAVASGAVMIDVDGRALDERLQ